MTKKFVTFDSGHSFYNRDLITKIEGLNKTSTNLHLSSGVVVPIAVAVQEVADTLNNVVPEEKFLKYSGM